MSSSRLNWFDPVLITMIPTIRSFRLLLRTLSIEGVWRESDSYFIFGLRGRDENGGENSTIILSITIPFPFKIERKRRKRKGISILNFLITIITILKNNYFSIK